MASIHFLAPVPARSTAEPPLPPGIAAVGEVGLDGDIRPVSGLRHRVAELARVGARRVLVPAARAGADEALPRTSGCDVVQVRSLHEAIVAAQRPAIMVVDPH